MRIGVTGIFASGKGTVCSMFQELGAIVIDTDLLAREVVEPGSAGLQLIEFEFGSKFITREGTLDRRALARKVFQDPDQVERLNSITHPLIMQLVIERTGNQERIYMVNTPLLFESGFDKLMHKNIVVVAGDEQVIERGIKRDNISGEEIKERLNHQISLNEKKKMADYVIDNSGTLENTQRQVVELWKTLTELQEK